MKYNGGVALGLLNGLVLNRECVGLAYIKFLCSPGLG